MFKNKTFKILIPVIILQILVFSIMIIYSVKDNTEIQYGTEYTMLVDPIYLDEGEVIFSTRTNYNEILSWYLDDYNYAVIGVDKNGKAIFCDFTVQKPQDKDYVKINDNNVEKFHTYKTEIDKDIYYSFSNISMEEPYIKFKVKDGNVLITELGIAGISIEEWIEEPVTKDARGSENKDEPVW